MSCTFVGVKNVCDILGHCLGGLKSMNLWFFWRGRWWRRKSGYCQLRCLAMYRNGCFPSLTATAETSKVAPQTTYNLYILSSHWDPSGGFIHVNISLFRCPQLGNVWCVPKLVFWMIHLHGTKRYFSLFPICILKATSKHPNLAQPHTPLPKKKLLVVENSPLPPLPLNDFQPPPLRPALP